MHPAVPAAETDPEKGRGYVPEAFYGVLFQHGAGLQSGGDDRCAGGECRREYLSGCPGGPLEKEHEEPRSGYFQQGAAKGAELQLPRLRDKRHSAAGGKRAAGWSLWRYAGSCGLGVLRGGTAG